MGRKPKPRPVILCNRPGCGVALTARQQTRGVRHCCMACANAMRAEVRFRECQRCGKALTPAQMRNRGKYCGPACARADRLHYPHQESAPAPIAPQEPAGEPTARVLWMEGRTRYVVGVLNKVEVVYDGKGVYCTLAQWPQSPAGRRSQAPKPDVTLLMVEPVSAWRRAGREATIDE